MPAKTRASARAAASSSKKNDDSPVQNNIGNDEQDNNDSNNDEKSGSGLAAFFGDFLPGSSERSFSKGLSELQESVPMEHANHIEASIGVRYVQGGLNYGDWRRKEKESLTEYLMLRLHPHPDNDEDDSAGSSSEESSQENNEATQAESQLGMETQEPVKSSLNTKPKRRKNIVPYVEDCLHDLRKLEFLDLHAKTLSLNLGRIDKVWTLRNPKRYSSSIRKPVFEQLGKRRKQRLVFEEREEDGPVATIYKKVISLEIEELQLYDQLLPNNSPKKHNSRIKVFFYNSYATAISDWLKEQQKQKHSTTKRIKKDDNTDTEITVSPTDIIVQLSNVPAACIFPCKLDPRNWREQRHMVDYCLCIGDNSVATNRRTPQAADSNQHLIRFDSTELEIRLLAVTTKTTTTKTRKHAGTMVTTNTIDEVDTSSELVLSRRALAKEFLSSSGEDTVMGKLSDEPTTSPLEASWEAYRKHKDASQQQSVTEKPKLTQMEQSQVSANEKKSKTTNSKETIAVEPMIFEGATPRRSDTAVFHYVKLGDITKMVEESRNTGKGCNFKVNVYAAVVGVTPPRITKRGDWMIAATLLDESCPTTPMTINIFAKKQDQLPNLIWMGDVIRIHRAAIDKWYNKIQLQGLKPTQYVVIRKISGNWKVIPTAQNSFTFNRSDEKRSQTLWRWANLHSSKIPTMKAEHCFTLEEMQRLKSEDDERTFEHRDITVMVVQKLRYQYADVLPHGLLRVWDGTGNPPSDPLFMPGRIQNPLPEEQPSTSYPRALEQVISTSQQLQASCAMETPISLCGRFSNVVIWEKSHWALIEKHVPVGTFLRLRNVHIPKRWEGNNFRSIFMHDKSWMTGLPTNNYEIRSMLLKHSERIRKGASYNREFGNVSLSACRFVGNGLSGFAVSTSTANVYTGAVHLFIEASIPSMVKVADRSGSVSALAAPKIHLQLKTLQQPNAVSENRRFLVRIRRIVVNNGSKQHLVLTNVAPMD